MRLTEQETVSDPISLMVDDLQVFLRTGMNLNSRC